MAKKAKTNNSRLFGLFILLILVAAIALTVIMSQQQTREKSEASLLSKPIPPTPRKKDLFVNVRGSCAGEYREYFFGTRRSANDPSWASVSVRREYKRGWGAWTPIPSNGEMSIRAIPYDQAGNKENYYRATVIYDFGGGSYTQSEPSEPIQFTSTCYIESAAHISDIMACIPYGDVNMDGYRSSHDSSSILNHIARTNGWVLTDPVKLFNADIDRNGRIEAADSMIILRDVAGLPTNHCEYRR